MIAWVDVEASGLNEQTGHLMEIALVITDDDLNEVDLFSTVVQPPSKLPISVADMEDDKVREMHTKNGLLAELRAESGWLWLWEAEEAAIRFVSKTLPGEVELDVCTHCKKKRADHRLVTLYAQACDESWPDGAGGRYFTAKRVTLASQTPLAGSTVAFDKRWLRAHMPKLERLFSYRSIDVSSLTELAKRWAPAVYEARPRNDAAHRALADVRESIAYLRYFRECGFVGAGNWGVPATAMTVMEKVREHRQQYPSGCSHTSCDVCSHPTLGARR